MRAHRLIAAFESEDEPTQVAADDPRRALDAVLGEVKGTGRYAISGRTASLSPTIDVAGLGVLSLPLVASQAQALIALAERAPYGRGDETLVDTAVRKSWQLAPDQLRFFDPLWERRSLPRIVAKVKAGLGVTADVEAQLYKLLVYEEGGFFHEHRDTEKTPGMFGTLVIALPSQHEGGQLVVRHGDESMTLDLRNMSLSRATFAAFYTDCLHSLAPVTGGYRACLVYNLVSKERLSAPSYHQLRAPIVRALRALAAAPGAPKVVRVLSHHYTEAAIAFEALKGVDAVIADLVTSAAPEAGFRVYLGMVSIHENGAAEPADPYDHARSRRRRGAHSADDADAYEVIDVNECETNVVGLLSPSGGEAMLDAIPIFADEVSPLGLLASEPFDEEHFSEATGNEGGSFERTYRRAALVFWPIERDYDVLAQLPLHARIDALIAPVVAGDPRALALLESLCEDCLIEARYTGGLTRSTLLGLLVHAGRFELLTRFIERAFLSVAGQGHASRGDPLRSSYAKADNEGLVTALRALPAVQSGALVRRFVALHVARTRFHAPIVDLITTLGSQLDAVARAAAEGVVDGLAAEPVKGWEPSPLTFIPTLVTALDKLDAQDGTAHALTALAHMLSRPVEFELDRQLVPAALDVAAGAPGAGARHLIAAVREALEARTRIRPEPPPTWARESQLRCKCADCGLARSFLVDSAQAVWQHKASEERRKHLESQLRGSDVTTATLRNSRPLTLQVTKTTASYERNIARYYRDREISDTLASV